MYYNTTMFVSIVTKIVSGEKPEVSRTKGDCHVIYIFLGSSLAKL